MKCTHRHPNISPIKPAKIRPIYKEKLNGRHVQKEYWKLDSDLAAKFSAIAKAGNNLIAATTKLGRAVRKIGLQKSLGR